MEGTTEGEPGSRPELEARVKREAVDFVNIKVFSTGRIEKEAGETELRHSWRKRLLEVYMQPWPQS